MKIESMEELFLQQIEDLYDAEKRLVKALPKMAEASTSINLRQAFQSHLRETEGHVNRLETIFRQMGKSPKGQTCDAMKGLVSEGEDTVSHIDQSPLRDAGLIAAANRVEHYEMAGVWIGANFCSDARPHSSRNSASANTARREGSRPEAHANRRKHGQRRSAKTQPRFTLIDRQARRATCFGPPFVVRGVDLRPVRIVGCYSRTRFR